MIIKSKAPLLNNWFIKNEDFLDEVFRDKDLLNRDNDIIEFGEKLRKIKKTWIIWFIGPFWSGKTTFLNQVSKKVGWTWINFESWQYPDRKDLWENFVLEIAQHFWEKFYEKYKNKIEGSKWDSWNKILNWSSVLAGVIWSILWTIAPFEWWLVSASSDILKWIQNFMSGAPLTKVYQFQEILRECLEWILKNGWDNQLYIIVEDVDRSWSAWLYFIETLSFFLKKYFLDKKIIVIAPISDDSFNKHKNIYLKALDNYYIFEKSKYDFTEFINEIFSEDVIEFWNFWEILNELFTWIFDEFYNQINLRFFKAILRIINQEYYFINKEGNRNRLDFRFYFIFSLSRHFQVFNPITKSYISLFLWNEENPFEKWDDGIHNTCFHKAIKRLIYTYQDWLDFYWIAFVDCDYVFDIKPSKESYWEYVSIYFSDKYLTNMQHKYSDTLYLNN